MPTTVMVVEDEPNIGALVRTYLERAGYRALWVRSGEDALTELRRHPVRLVILDIGLPGIDGNEVARRLRERPEFEGALLVALTGWGQEADVERSRAAGFDHHLVKPANPEAIRELLATAGGPP